MATFSCMGEGDEAAVDRRSIFFDGEEELIFRNYNDER